MPGRKAGSGTSTTSPGTQAAAERIRQRKAARELAAETRATKAAARIRKNRSGPELATHVVDELNRAGRVRLSKSEQKELLKWKPQIDRAMRGRTFDLRGDFLHLRDRPGSAVGGFLRGIGHEAVGSVFEAAREPNNPNELGPDWMSDPRMRGAGLAAKTALDFQIGPDARKAITGQEGFSAPWAIGGGLLGVIPFKGGTGALKGASGALRGGKAGMRTLQVGEHVQQLPTARSRFTRSFIEGPADKVSNWIMKEDSKAATLIRKAEGLKFLPNPSARARVAKGAGAAQSARAAREQAKMVPNLNALPDEDSIEDVAHYWWAQLPKSFRNVEGLKLVRNARAKELDDLINFQDAPTRQIESSDLPLKIEDLSASIARLDQIIANPPKLNQKIIDAVRALSLDRRSILTKAAVLDDDVAAVREGLVSRWLGVEPTGEEAFIGHRSKKVRGANPSLLPSSPGVGRVRLPEGVTQENKLILAKTGRVRESTHVAAQDWQASQTYRSGVLSRDELGAMGDPFDINKGLPEGSVLINPKGRVFPSHWKKDRLPDIKDGDEEELRKAAAEIVESFLSEPTTPEELDAYLAAVLEEGVQWNELRVVPSSVVSRYYGQFTPVRGATTGGKAYDTAVDFMAASIIFARLGYIPKNIAQNLIMSIPHQGPFALMNIPRAAQILADPDLRHLFSAEVGFSGATAGIGRELSGFGSKAKGIPARSAELVGKIADNPLRISALVHEIAAEGVIPRFSPFLSAADKQKLLALWTPANEALLNNVRWRATDAMGDFSRLTPSQRKWARRFLIIPGWLWAGSRYPIHFAATHPGRSAAIGYAAAGAPGLEEVGGPDLPPVTDFMASGLPYYLEGIGGDKGKVMRTTSLSPVSTPWEILAAATGSSPRTVGSYANPLITGAYNTFNQQKQGPFGAYPAEGYRDAGEASLARLAPNYDFIRDLVSPPQDDPRYPGDKSRLGRIARESGVVPIEITRDEKTGAKAKNETDLSVTSSAIDKHMPAKFKRQAQKDLKQAYTQKTQVDVLRAKIQKDTDAGLPYYQAVYPAELDLAVKWGIITPAIAKKQKAWAATADQKELEKETRYFRDHILPDYNGAIADVKGALEYYGWKPSKPK